MMAGEGGAAGGDYEGVARRTSVRGVAQRHDRGKRGRAGGGGAGVGGRAGWGSAERAAPRALLSSEPPPEPLPDALTEVLSSEPPDPLPPPEVLSPEPPPLVPGALSSEPEGPLLLSSPGWTAPCPVSSDASGVGVIDGLGT